MPTPSTAPPGAARAPSRTAWLIDRRDRVRAWWLAIDWGARSDRRAVYVLVALMVGVGALLMYMGRGETFYYDDWAYVVEKYGGGLRSLLLPHSEHFSLIPIAIYKVLFHLVGIDHYQVFRLVLVVFHLICVALIYDLARRRIGAWPALVAATAILCLFAAWQNLIWAFQISFVGSVLGGLAAWALIDRNTRACDIGACVAVAVALSCSGLGLPFVPGIAIELLWLRQPRRLWLVAAPFALYLLWYSHYGVSMVLRRRSLPALSGSRTWPRRSWSAGRQGRRLGDPVDGGGADARRSAVRERRERHPRLVGAVLTALTYWVLTGISRSLLQTPDESRYAYLSAVLVVVIALELAPAMRFPGRAVGLGIVVVGAGALMGWQTLHTNALVLRSDGQTIAAQLGGLQVGGTTRLRPTPPTPRSRPTSRRDRICTPRAR